MYLYIYNQCICIRKISFKWSINKASLFLGANWSSFRNKANISSPSRFHHPASSPVQGRSDQVPFPSSQFPQSSHGLSTRTAARMPSGHASHLEDGSRSFRKMKTMDENHKKMVVLWWFNAILWIYPLAMTNIAHHRNSEFSHWTWWFSSSLC